MKGFLNGPDEQEECFSDQLFEKSRAVSFNVSCVPEVRWI